MSLYRWLDLHWQSNLSIFEEFKKAMTREFEMMDIVLMSYYLWIEVK